MIEARSVGRELIKGGAQCLEIKNHANLVSIFL